MSWEEMSASQTVCPCGKGHIKQRHYGDDWNRFEDDSIIIECEECNNKYEVEEVTNQGMISSDGFWSEYFLIPKDYSRYDGPSETDTYGILANPNWDFTGWLIQNFSEAELKKVKKQLIVVKSSSKLTGKASYICKEHKRALKSVRMSAILNSIERALSAYPGYVGNKKQRAEIRKQEKIALNNYWKEKKKHSILINLQ